MTHEQAWQEGLALADAVQKGLKIDCHDPEFWYFIAGECSRRFGDVSLFDDEIIRLINE
jgi:hypothetical protein